MYPRRGGPEGAGPEGAGPEGASPEGAGVCVWHTRRRGGPGQEVTVGRGRRGPWGRKPARLRSRAGAMNGRDGGGARPRAGPGGSGREGSRAVS